MNTMTTTIDQTILDGITSGQTISLDYQGNPREIIPLVYGVVKNGREALLCYKINRRMDNDLSIRLYYADKIGNMQLNEERLAFSRKVGYYLTKHFRSVYAKA